MIMELRSVRSFLDKGAADHRFDPDPSKVTPLPPRPEELKWPTFRV
jgi:hypothetical protein